jgi:two-component system, cell cycle sensor histidine kinase and response regulator CckA
MINNVAKPAALLESFLSVRTAATVDDLVRLALDSLFRTIVPDLAAFYLKVGDRLQRIGVRGSTHHPESRIEQAATVLEAFCAGALCGSHLYSLDLAGEPGTAQEGELPRLAAAAMPLVGRGGVQGVLGIATFTQRDFRRRYVMLDGLAGQAAVVLERIRAESSLTDALSRIGVSDAARAAAEERCSRLEPAAMACAAAFQAQHEGETVRVCAESLCKLVAEHGGFPAVRLVRQSTPSGIPEVLARAGESGAFDGDLFLSQTALQSRRSFVCNDLAANAPGQPWSDRALRSGFRAAGAFLLVSGSRLKGALEVCARNAGAFDEPALQLLESLARGICLSLDSLEHESELVQALDGLRASETNAREIIERMPAITYLVSPTQPLCATFVSEEIERSLGFTREEWLSSPDLWIRQIHPDDRDRVSIERTVLGDGPGEFTSEYRILSKDGVERWWHDKISIIRGADGRIEHLQGVVLDITERRGQEEALRSEANLFTRAMGAAGDGIWDWDIRTGEVRYSPGFFEMLGYDPGDFSTHYSAWLSLVHPQDLTIVLRAHVDCAEGKQEGFAIEIRMKSREGRWRWILSRAKVVERNRSNQPVRIAGTQVDITVRKRVEQALAESVQRYRKLFKSSPQPALVVARDTRAILDANAAAIDRYGYSLEEILGLTLEDLTVHGPGADAVALPCDGDEIECCGVSALHRRKDGSLIDVELRAHDLEFGGKLATLVVVYDVTRRKKAEEERLRLVSLVENSTDFIGLAALDGRILYVNNAGLKLVGEKSLAEAQERYVFDYFAEERAPGETRRLFPEVLEKGSWSGRERFRNMQNAEPVPLEIHSFVVREAGSGREIALAVVGRDTSARKKLEAQFLQAQKMEAIGRLVGGIAHDFNNILTAIMGYSGLLKVRVADDELARGYTDSVLASAERAARLTQSLLAYSRKQLIKAQPIDLRSIIGRLESMLVRIIGEDISFRTLLPAERLVVMADQNQLELAIMNLITNARDAMPHGGSLLISASVVTLGEEYIRSHSYVEAGMYAQLSVPDTGIGMDEEPRRKVFEPFFTTKEPGKGTGLGLSMVYGAVKQHGGYVDVESEPGQGTTVRIYLPLLTADIDSEEPGDLGQPLPAKATVLVAEDDSSVRLLVRDTLAGLGLRVVEAADGADALEKFKANPDGIDLLLLDAIMPKKSGVEVYRAVKAIRPRVKVLFASGYSHDIAPLREVFREEVGYISKPFSSQQLLQKIRKALVSSEPR